MSDIKLAATLKITKREASKLIEDYFRAFPRIKKLLAFLGRFGVENGYSMTMAPFFRKRYYPDWSSVKQYIPAFLGDIEYNKTLGEIERASKNMPVQGKLKTEPWLNCVNSVNPYSEVCGIPSQAALN